MSSRHEITFAATWASGEFVDKSPPAIGEAKYDDYTILIVINFTRSGADKQKWDWEPGLS